MARLSLSAAGFGDDEEPDAPTPPVTDPPPVVEDVPVPASADPEPDDPAPEPGTPAVVGTTKYTMKLTYDEDDQVARVVAAVTAEIRAAGTRPTKELRAEIIRALFDRLDRDQAFRTRTAREVLRRLRR
jgi:hypothetical protein